MAIRNIRELGEECLRKVCKPVKDVNLRTKILIGDMFDTMYEANGVGLAAPQLGKSIQMIALLVPGFEDEEPILNEVWINPRIMRESVKKACLKEGEGCLSVERDVPGIVLRSERVTVKYQDVNGDEFVRTLTDYEAIVVQHEIDHLNGVMFYDHINKTQPMHIPKGAVVIGE